MYPNFYINMFNSSGRATIKFKNRYFCMGNGDRSLTAYVNSSGADQMLPARIKERKL